MASVPLPPRPSSVAAPSTVPAPSGPVPRVPSDVFPDDSPDFDDGLIHLDDVMPAWSDAGPGAGSGTDATTGGMVAGGAENGACVDDGTGNPPSGPVSVRRLAQLTGVRATDMDDEFERRARHGRPRLRFTATHALAAILIMTFVTCVSLTLLIRQSMNYAALDRAGASSSVVEPNRMDGSDGAGVEDDTGSGIGHDAGRSTDDGASAPDGTAVQPTESDTDDPPADADTRIDLNSATLDQLDAIPGVGPVTAQRILDHRARIGRFSSVDQLLDVSGIGEKTLEKIRPEVTVR